MFNFEIRIVFIFILFYRCFFPIFVHVFYFWNKFLGGLQVCASQNPPSFPGLIISYFPRLTSLIFIHNPLLCPGSSHPLINHNYLPSPALFFHSTSIHFTFSFSSPSSFPPPSLPHSSAKPGGRWQLKTRGELIIIITMPDGAGIWLSAGARLMTQDSQRLSVRAAAHKLCEASS